MPCDGDRLRFRSRREGHRVAYEAVLLDLHLVDRHDPLTEIIANNIIECAATGELDVDRLPDQTLQHIRG